MVMPSLVDAQLGLESEWIPHVTAGHSRQPLPAAGVRCPQLVSDAPAARSWCPMPPLLVSDARCPLLVSDARCPQLVSDARCPQLVPIVRAHQH